MSAPVNQPVTSLTPILDRLEKLPPLRTSASKTANAVGLAVGIAIGMVVNLFVFWPPSSMQGIHRWVLTTFAPMFAGEMTALSVLWLPLAGIVGFIAAMAVHESAHALVGSLVGFRFNSLRISRLEVHRPFRLSFYRGRGTGAGGWATMFPVKQDKLISRAVAMLFAGPAANLLSASLVLMLPFAKSYFTAGFLCWSFIFGLINLIPLRSRAMLSDGKRILMLLRNGPQGERWLAMLRLSAELREGVMPESLTAAFVDKAVALRDDSPDTVSAYSIAYARAFYANDDAEAAQLLEICLQYSCWTAPIVREVLIGDAAVFQAKRRKRVDLAEQWMADLPAKTELPWLRMRSEAAILELTGDRDGALKKLNEVERAIAMIPNQASREISLRFVRRSIAELQAEPAGS